MRRLFALGAVLCLCAFASTPAFAVTIHEHWLTTGTGELISVGPEACGQSTDSGLYNGWLNFHENVHVGVPGTQAFDSASNPVDISATHCPE
jgi:hypothetical protein